MFDNLQKLIDSLCLDNPLNYKDCKEARKTLQQIKVESQNLRNLITKNLKDSKVKK